MRVLSFRIYGSVVLLTLCATGLGSCGQCSHRASSVAAFYSESGSLTINDGAPAIGRKAVEGAAQSFMTAYPDLVVKFDRREPKGNRVLYHWTFTGLILARVVRGIRSGSADTRIGRSGRTD
jgi:hypothetical protein